MKILKLKVSNYAFFVTTSCMIFIYFILSQIKDALERESIAKAISITTISF